MQKYTYHVQWLHCPSCKILIEDIMEENTGVKGEVQVKKQILSYQCEDEETAKKHISTIAPLLREHGYTISDKKTEDENDGLIWQALPIGIIILILFIVLQKSGILNFSIDGSITPTTSFILWIIASVSSCLAVVGGLILSLSAQFGSHGAQGKTSIILFHSARIVAFALLGGLLGMIGKAMGINPIFTAVLGIIASLVMIFLGLNLAGIFQNTLTLPSSLFSIFRKKWGAILMPIIVGAGTFFLPCGFTQSMQITALSSWSFIGWLSIMLFFALGTFPMLALLSFGSVSFAQSRYAPLFFKSIGIVVIGLGTLTLLTGLTSLGILPPIINF